MRRPVHTYNDGQPYRPARGRDGARTAVEDHWRQWNVTHAVIDLASEQPTPQVFVPKMIREMKIRGYARSTIAAYRSSLTQFFRWFSHLPHEVTREDVREFLELIVDAEKDTATLGVHLTALRTTLDKMCGRDVTLGLVTPRKSKHIPVVLSRNEAEALISAADRRRDKLLVALLYGSGVRVSEVVKLQVRDFDFDRCLIRVRRAKGRKDRMVLLPKSFLALIRSETVGQSGDCYLFPSPQRPHRHLSPRTVQRQLHRIATIAGIRKNVTPHALRHSFACHALENGMDIRHIQELLGHANLETTTIYTRLAQTQSECTHSPLDVTRGFASDRTTPADSVAAMTVHTRPHPEQTDKRTLQVTVEINAKPHESSIATAESQPTAAFGPVFLTGALAIEQRPGYLSVLLPSSAEWDDKLTSVPSAVRERISDPHFYRILTEAIETRFLQQKW